MAPLLGDRNYEVYSWLFGVCRRPDIPMRWDFPPMAAERGLPPDASREAAAEYADHIARFPTEIHGASWATLSEMLAIDWDEPIEDRVIESRRGQQVSEYWRSQLRPKRADIVAGHIETLRPGQRWTEGDTTYEVVAMRRRDALEHEWALLFRLMETLASRWNDASGVRMVVWFAI